MPKKELQYYLCLRFCPFYKPDSKEALLCRGAWLVERLIQEKRLDPVDFQGLERGVPIFPGSERDLETLVCKNCSFQEDDCDFQSIPPPANASPCGGLLLLKQLLDTRKIALGDLSVVTD
jgi:hypothetical protein